MQIVKVFKLGNAQAVRIPARYRFDVDEVEVFQRGEELVLRAKPRTALDLFTGIRERGADYGDWVRPEQGTGDPAPPWD